MSEFKRTADDDRIELRRLKAIELRVAGKTFREIAKELGVSLAVAHNDVREVLEEVDEKTTKLAETERRIELARLDQATQLCMQVINDALQLDPGEEDPDKAIAVAAELKLKAVDRLVKVQERRAKLIGLDAPTKQEVALDTTEASPAKAREIMKSLFSSDATPDKLAATSDGGAETE